MSELLLVHPKIRRRLMPLSPEERNLLEQSVLTEGIRDPLIVWRSNGRRYLLDGHQRHDLASKHSLPFAVQEIHLPGLVAALDWLDRNQLARRNLNTEQRALVLGRVYERAKRQGARTDRTSGQKDRKWAAEQLGLANGVDERTVRRAAAFARAMTRLEDVNPEAAQRILQSEIRDALTRLPKLARDPARLREVAEVIADGRCSRIRDAKTELLRRKMGRPVKPPADAGPFGRWRTNGIYVADMCSPAFLAALPSDSVDLVLTDPPWDNLRAYEAVAEIAAKALKPGRIAAVYAGKRDLDKILPVLKKRLTYLWPLCVSTPGMSSAIRTVHLYSGWQPVVLLRKPGPAVEMLWGPDVLISNRDKGWHSQQQGIDPALEIIRRYSQPGDLVFDPCVGGGTVPTAARLLSRRFVGFDIDEEAVRRTMARLEQAQGGASSATTARHPREDS